MAAAVLLSGEEITIYIARVSERLQTWERGTCCHYFVHVHSSQAVNVVLAKTETCTLTSNTCGTKPADRRRNFPSNLIEKTFRGSLSARTYCNRGKHAASQAGRVHMGENIAGYTLSLSLSLSLSLCSPPFLFLSLVAE